VSKSTNIRQTPYDNTYEHSNNGYVREEQLFGEHGLDNEARVSASRGARYSSDYDETDQNTLYDDTSSVYSRVAGPRDIEALTIPVIIPRQQSKSSSSGWAIAYAPSLSQSGIDLETFTNFIIHLNQACDASPVLDVVNLGAFDTATAPGIALTNVSRAVPVAVQVAQDTQTKTLSAAYLRKVNAELFKPRGLVAFITTWEPNQASPVITMNLATVTWKDPYAPQLQLPESAQLIYRNERDVDGYPIRKSYQESGVKNGRISQVEPFGRGPEMGQLPRTSKVQTQLRDPWTVRVDSNIPYRKRNGKLSKKDKRRFSFSDPDAYFDTEDDRIFKDSMTPHRSSGGLISMAIGAISAQSGQVTRNQGLIGGLKGMAMSNRGPRQGLVRGLTQNAFGKTQNNGRVMGSQGLIEGSRGVALRSSQQNPGSNTEPTTDPVQQNTMFLMIANRPRAETSVEAAYDYM
jgi:hypothetical protein